MNLDNHPIVKNKIPFLVRYIIRSTHLPENEKELIQFSQELAKLIIKDIEPIKLN
jgi:hypothetical protein